MVHGAGRVAETELELAQRSRCPYLKQPHSQAAAESERLVGTAPALCIPPSARLQPGQAGQPECELGLLAALPGQADRLLVGALGDRPAVGRDPVARDQVESEREYADRGM